jgi:hypothetical protein
VLAQSAFISIAARYCRTEWIKDLSIHCNAVSQLPPHILQESSSEQYRFITAISDHFVVIDYTVAVAKSNHRPVRSSAVKIFWLGKQLQCQE